MGLREKKKKEKRAQRAKKWALILDLKLEKTNQSIFIAVSWAHLLQAICLPRFNSCSAMGRCWWEFSTWRGGAASRSSWHRSWLHFWDLNPHVFQRQNTHCRFWWHFDCWLWPRLHQKKRKSRLKWFLPCCLCVAHFFNSHSWNKWKDWTLNSLFHNEWPLLYCHRCQQSGEHIEETAWKVTVWRQREKNTDITCNTPIDLKMGLSQTSMT